MAEITSKELDWTGVCVVRSCSSQVWFGENILDSTYLPGCEGPFLEFVSQNYLFGKLFHTKFYITPLLTINYLNIKLRSLLWFFWLCQNASGVERELVLVPISIRLLEVGLAVLGVGDHRGLAGLPASWADLAVFVCVLEGLDQSESLVHISAHGEIVDRHLSQLS